MTPQVVFAITSLVLAVLGSLWVGLVLRRNLPVPDGRFYFVRFLFWWSVSVGIGGMVFVFVTAVVSAKMMPGLFSVGIDGLPWLFIIMLPPYLTGLLYGVYLQFFSEGVAKT